MNYRQKRRAFMLAIHLRAYIRKYGQCEVRIVDNVITLCPQGMTKYLFEYAGEDAAMILAYAKKFLRRMLRRDGYGLRTAA